MVEPVKEDGRPGNLSGRPRISLSYWSIIGKAEPYSAASYCIVSLSLS